MASTLTVRDTGLTGKTIREFSLDLLTERITIRELIRSRVYQEVQDYNQSSSKVAFQGLVQPSEVEGSLNGAQPTQRKQINWKPQFEKAIEAFESQQVLILVDDQQATSLDAEVEITPSTVVSFLKLTPLVGG